MRPFRCRCGRIPLRESTLPGEAGWRGHQPCSSFRGFLIGIPLWTRIPRQHMFQRNLRPAPSVCADKNVKVGHPSFNTRPGMAAIAGGGTIMLSPVDRRLAA